MAVHAQDDIDEAVAFYDQVVDRYGDHTSREMRERGADALFRKAYLLYSLHAEGRIVPLGFGLAEAIEAYKQAVTRYVRRPKPTWEDLIARINP